MIQEHVNYFSFPCQDNNLVQGKLMALTIKKQGVIRGRGENKRRYGDDLIRTFIWVGYDYALLKEGCFKILQDRFLNTDQFIMGLAEAVWPQFRDVTYEDATIALQDVLHSLANNSLHRTGEPNQVLEEPKSDSVWVPVFRNGRKVPGIHLYNGLLTPNGPIPGTYYVDGLHLGEKVLAKSTPWVTKTKDAQSAIRSILRDALPISRFVRYRLDNLDKHLLMFGNEAYANAKAHYVNLNFSLLGVLNEKSK